MPRPRRSPANSRASVGAADGAPRGLPDTFYWQEYLAKLLAGGSTPLKSQLCVLWRVLFPGIDQWSTIMLRKTIIALFAIASVSMLVPDIASARGGFGGGGGGGFR